MIRGPGRGKNTAANHNGDLSQFQSRTLVFARESWQFRGHFCTCSSRLLNENITEASPCIISLSQKSH